MKFIRFASWIVFLVVIFNVFDSAKAEDVKRKNFVSNERRRKHSKESENQQRTLSSDNDLLEQKPMDLDTEWLQLQKQKIEARRNKTRASYKPTAKRELSRANGRSCKFNTDCESQCCRINKRTNRRHCSPMSGVGQRCDSMPVKGGAHLGYCPCASGYSACEYNPKKKRGFGFCKA